jgi:hypothetical protein
MLAHKKTPGRAFKAEGATSGVVIHDMGRRDEIFLIFFGASR